MSDTITWRGASNQRYTYYLHTLPWRPTNEHKGNYIFAKRSSGDWFAVYIGQGNLQVRYDAALEEGCITKKGATHYLVHTNDNEATREAEERDLIEGNPECNWPNGCNGHD